MHRENSSGQEFNAIVVPLALGGRGRVNVV